MNINWSLNYNQLIMCDTIDFKKARNATKTYTKEASVLSTLLPLGEQDTAYEMVSNVKFIKPYFDIDIKPIHDNFDEIYQEKETLLIQWLDVLREKYGADSEFAISESSMTNVKISYHIIIWNKKTTMKHMYMSTRKMPFPFDTKPYISKEAPTFQKFRMVYTAKEDELERKLLPITCTNEVDKHFISNPTQNAILYEYVKEETVKQTRVPNEKGKGIGSCLIQTDDRKEWLTIGISLFTIYGEQIGREEFAIYSQNWKDFNLTNFDKTWNDILHYQYTNGGWCVLKKYLPTEEWVKYIPMLPPYEMNDKKLATWFFHHFNKYKIRYSDGEFFKFEKHRWENLADEELFRDVMFYITDAYDNLMSSCDDEEREKVRKIAHKAGMYNYINQIVKTIKTISSDSKFRDKLNQNRHLLGFDNGVYDLISKEFRNGLPTDYLTYTVGYDYQEKVDNEKMEYIKEIILNTMCGNIEMYNCLLTMLGRTIIGDNSITNQRFYCWYGEGKNGKSSIQNLICETFGDYYKNPPTSLMTQNEARADGHNADIQNLVGSRFCFLSETKDGVLNPQTLKRHTGENRLEYRAVYGRVKHSTLISWTPILVSNDKIKINCDDNGVVRRFVYIPFKACFVDNVEDFEGVNNGIKYYKSIENIDDVLKEHKMEFLHLLLEHCQYNQKLVFCDSVNDETKQLIKSQDMLLDMIKTGFVKSTEKGVGIPLSDMKAYLACESRNANAALFKQMKNKLPLPDLEEKIVKRCQGIGASFVGVAGGKQFKYTNSQSEYGRISQSRRLFYGIDYAKQDEGDDVVEECAI
jgi:P4 family phage/plasmid primase-like protien